MPAIFNTETRIVNGFDTRKALPYQLGIRYHILGDRAYGCGGILISSKFGITADHCVDVTEFMVNDVTVFAGAYKWEGDGFPDGEPCTSLNGKDCGDVSLF